MASGARGCDGWHRGERTGGGRNLGGWLAALGGGVECSCRNRIAGRCATGVALVRQQTLNVRSGGGRGDWECCGHGGVGGGGPDGRGTSRADVAVADGCRRFEW